MPLYTILYLDDEADNLAAFHAVFRRHYKVLTAGTAEEAISLLNDHPIQLVISDQRMPGTSGVEFLTMLSEQHPKIIRMILTGYSDMQATIDAINKGKIYYYITKPWKFEELKLIIDNALDAFALREHNNKLKEENQALLLKNLQQEKENLASRFEVLRDQINPHFLFNCLNTLVSLIGSEPETAIKFTVQFARMYRRILEMGDEKLIPLEREIELLDSYIYLQKMRFGSNLKLKVAIDELRYVLPPFALQLLAENSIKHNIISNNQTLEITITQKGNTLEVANNLSLRPIEEPSTGLGLKNLRSRYVLLTGMDLNIEKNIETFKVTLPLIPEF
ncbi:MAG: histidine kinase [Saprospiraceae bacterium]|nr:histidine kinase [Saprospiraceae bacterium]